MLYNYLSEFILLNNQLGVEIFQGILKVKLSECLSFAGLFRIRGISEHEGNQLQLLQ